MKALISRDSHRPDQRYSGVYHIQGAMITDADLDERSAISRDAIDNLGRDAVAEGGPARGGAVRILEDGRPFLGEGVIYARGVRGDLAAAEGATLGGPLDIFTQQADLPLGPSLPTDGDFILYADIWERPVFPLEDAYLADVGLHGAVTAFRMRRMTQIKAAPASARTDIEAGRGAFPEIGTADLSVTPLNAEILADPCDPCAEVVSLEQEVANALWRLEVISIEGTADKPSSIVLAWSEENAAEIVPATVEADAFARSNKVYEYFSPITEARAGVYANAADARLPVFVDDLATTPSPPKDHDGEDWPFLRRWDGFAKIDLAAGEVSSTLGGGFELSLSGSRITLRVAAFVAELDVDGASVVPGDYWLVELRRHAPETERIRLVSAQPVGIRHHYCTLFTVSDGGIAELSDSDRRKLSFPPLSDLPADHVALTNRCQKLYGDARNVQEALDKLCDISAADIGFTSNCPTLYGDAGNVQEALDALCRVDFSVQESFRLLFDWGVICGIVPQVAKPQSGVINITPGSYLDRSGRLTLFEGGTFDLDKLEFGEGKGIEFENPDRLMTFLQKGQVCLALAGQEGGKTTLHLVPPELAFGPADPGFLERVRSCVGEKKGIGIKDAIAALPAGRKAVATKVLLASSGEGAFQGTARLTRAEFAEAEAFSRSLVEAFGAIATEEETALLKARIERARQDHPIEDVRGDALEIRQMQQSMAVLEAFRQTEEERLQRCVCENWFPSCPPDLGKPPFFVPIACLRGSYSSDGISLQEVCAFCCRKQAMTWRSLQYFVGDIRPRLAMNLARNCCSRDEKMIKPGEARDPKRFATMDLLALLQDQKLDEAVLGRPPRLPSDFSTKVPVKNLGREDARKVLIDTGVRVEEEIDINDAKALDILREKLVGIEPGDPQLASAEVRPGDRVALLLQDGVARGYVLLEQGSGRLPFEIDRERVLGADIKQVEEVVARAEAVKGDFGALEKVREQLLADIDKLRAETAELEKRRDETAERLGSIREEVGDLAKKREALSKEVASAGKELAEFRDNYEKLFETLRGAQPVNVVLGNERKELVAALAGEGITTVAELAKLSSAAMKRLERSGLFRAGEGTELRETAAKLLKR